MASKKSSSAGAINNTPVGRRLGLKVSGGEFVNAGQIILRQRGSKFKTHRGSYFGKDFTIHAKYAGIVHFANGYVRVLSALNNEEKKND